MKTENITENLTHQEIRERLTERANRSLSQKIRWITMRWVQEKISPEEMLIQEQKLFDEVKRKITKIKRRLYSKINKQERTCQKKDTNI